MKCLELGAVLHKLKGGRTAVLYAQAKKQAEEYGILMLPLGLVCSETVINVKNESIYTQSGFKSVVISTGTGTILSGVMLGMKDTKIYAVSAGMNEKKQKKRILKLWEDIGESHNFDNVEFHMAEKEDYYEPETYDCPFPSHEYYDRKAYKWMIENYNKLEKPILFWNIGA